jgi:glutaredoxin-related protein
MIALIDRPLLDNKARVPAAAKTIAGFHADTLREVAEAVARDPVVVVGMSQNPFVKKARAALNEAGVPFTYLEYGSYFSQWKRRLAIKMWSGWPTFPQVYVRGALIGGNDETRAALADGSLKQILG